MRIGNFGVDDENHPKMAGGFVVQRYARSIGFWKRVVLDKNQRLTVNGAPAVIYADNTTIATCAEEEPRIGCVKVSFSRSNASKLTVIANLAKVHLSTLPDYRPKRAKKKQASAEWIIKTIPWKAPAKHKCPPVVVDLFEEGEWQGHDMLTKALSDSGDSFWIWQVRVICLLAAVLGVNLSLRSFKSIAGDAKLPSSVTKLVEGFGLSTGALAGLEVDPASSVLIVITTSALVAAVIWSFAGRILAMPFVPILAAGIVHLPRFCRWKQTRGAGPGQEVEKED